VHPQHSGPQLFVAESVEAEDGLSVTARLLGLVLMTSVTITSELSRMLLGGRQLTESRDGVRQYKSEYA